MYETFVVVASIYLGIGAAISLLFVILSYAYDIRVMRTGAFLYAGCIWPFTLGLLAVTLYLAHRFRQEADDHS